jgi:hypothetical protein
MKREKIFQQNTICRHWKRRNKGKTICCASNKGMKKYSEKIEKLLRPWHDRFIHELTKVEACHGQDARCRRGGSRA